MARKFTRLEFEGGGVVVVKSIKSTNKHTIKGNSTVNWKPSGEFSNDSHVSVVDRVIDLIGIKVKRRLCHQVVS